MATPIARALRLLAACLLTLSGIGHIAALWLRELTELAVLGALLGATYVIIAIGLFGQSRFSLFMGFALPGAMAAVLLRNPDAGNAVLPLDAGINLIVATSCAWILWRVRHEPSQ